MFIVSRRSKLLSAALIALALCPAMTSVARGEDENRYGPFNAFDLRSKYNTSFFPEPLLADEMDADQEVRFNWLHTEKTNHRADEASVEIEKSFHLLTVEVEVPYEREVETEDGEKSRSEGVGSIEIAARHPFYQYSAPSRGIDLTLGARVELAIATNSEVSHDNEIVAGVYETLALGEHFSIQASAAYSALFGPDEGGSQIVEYAVVLGYNFDIQSHVLWRITPVLELNGESGLNRDNRGDTELVGAAGAVFTFDSLGLVQPKWSIGYVFPVDEAARDEFRWGVVSSLIFEY